MIYFAIILIHIVTAAFRQLIKSLKAPLAAELGESRLYYMLRTGILDVKPTICPGIYEPLPCILPHNPLYNDETHS